MHNAIWKDKNLELNLKLRLFNVRIINILLYGCESWDITKKIMQNVRGFIARCFECIIRKKA